MDFLHPAHKLLEKHGISTWCSDRYAIFFPAAALPVNESLSANLQIRIKKSSNGIFLGYGSNHTNLTTHAHILTMKRILPVYFLALARNFQWSLDTVERLESTICSKAVKFFNLF